MIDIDIKTGQLSVAIIDIESKQIIDIEWYFNSLHKSITIDQSQYHWLEHWGKQVIDLETSQLSWISIDIAIEIEVWKSLA